MDIEQNIKDSIIRRAERLLHYNNLLIEQCDRFSQKEIFETQVIGHKTQDER